jgi:hypothetical protein
VNWGRWWIEQFAPDHDYLDAEIQERLGARDSITMRDFRKEFKGFFEEHVKTAR